MIAFMSSATYKVIGKGSTTITEVVEDLFALTGFAYRSCPAVPERFHKTIVVYVLDQYRPATTGAILKLALDPFRI